MNHDDLLNNSLRFLHANNNIKPNNPRLLINKIHNSCFSIISRCVLYICSFSYIYVQVNLVRKRALFPFRIGCRKCKRKQKEGSSYQTCFPLPRNTRAINLYWFPRARFVCLITFRYNFHCSNYYILSGPICFEITRCARDMPVCLRCKFATKSVVNDFANKHEINLSMKTFTKT